MAKGGFGKSLGTIKIKKTIPNVQRINTAGMINPKEVLLADMRWHYYEGERILAELKGQILNSENSEEYKYAQFCKNIARECAATVAPYIHPKLANIQSNTGGSNHESALLELE